jgi:LysR family transcriptional activator of nhaA
MRSLAKKLRRNFPQSLHGAPALLPSENKGVRGTLEKWFDTQDIRPRLIGEFEDSALMDVCSSERRGFTVVHTVVDRAALKH